MPDADSTFQTAREEAREILERMSSAEFGVALHRIGGAVPQNPDEPAEQWKQRNIDRLLLKYDIKEEVRIKVCRALGILTDDEREQNLIAEQVKSVRQATGATERSAGSAASMLNAFYVAVIISALALVASGVALWRTW